MNGLLPDADFLSLLCSCAHLLAIEGNEVLILDLFWQSLAFQVKDSLQYLKNKENESLYAN